MASPLSVLVVDDNKDAADALVALLNVQGYRASAAYSGAAAICEADTTRPDVVLLDIGMPETTGFDVARALRDYKRAPKPVIVAVTGASEPSDKLAARMAGFDHYLVKPVEMQALVSLLQNLGAR
ncbi:MAG TPA: response regulator [Burkholderiales bacterium]|jgi:DNA-binding response OmpR family regulator|nr:response regulator [Burkholderiales bacterium]